MFFVFIWVWVFFKFKVKGQNFCTFRKWVEKILDVQFFLILAWNINPFRKVTSWLHYFCQSLHAFCNLTAGLLWGRCEVDASLIRRACCKNNLLHPHSQIWAPLSPQGFILHNACSDLLHNFLFTQPAHWYKVVM